MTAFPTSHLSQENVLRDVHDPVTQSLRTTASATIVAPGGLEVDIDHTDDSIRLGDGSNLLTSTTESGKIGLDVNVITPLEITDGTDTLAVNPDGSINANVSIQPGIVSSAYNEIVAIASGVDTLVVAFTASVTTRLKQIDANGTNIAAYTVLINGVPADKKNTNFSSGLFCSFCYDKGLELLAGDTVALRVLHNRPTLGDFNGKIITVEA